MLARMIRMVRDFWIDWIPKFRYRVGTHTPASILPMQELFFNKKEEEAHPTKLDP